MDRTEQVQRVIDRMTRSGITAREAISAEVDSWSDDELITAWAELLVAEIEDGAA